MITSIQRRRIEEALTWSGDIGSCPDKERYAVRILDLFSELGIRNAPGNVESALRDLIAWEDCAGPCESVNAFLRSLLEDDCLVVF